MKVKVAILYGDNVLDAEWQTKSFKEEILAVDFIRRHRSKIHGINGTLTDGALLSHFEIMDLLRGN